MRDYISDLISILLGGIFGILIGVWIVKGAYDDEIKIVNDTWESKIEDCRKMKAFIYNNQVYRCEPTGKWAPVDFRSFM